jgi:hypothetical protein
MARRPIALAAAKRGGDAIPTTRSLAGLITVQMAFEQVGFPLNIYSDSEGGINVS